MEGAAFTTFSTTVFKFTKNVKKVVVFFPHLPAHISILRYDLFFCEISTKVQIHKWITNRLANLFQQCIKTLPMQFRRDILIISERRN